MVSADLYNVRGTLYNVSAVFVRGFLVTARREASPRPRECGHSASTGSFGGFRQTRHRLRMRGSPFAQTSRNLRFLGRCLRRANRDNVFVSLTPNRRLDESRKRDCEKFHKVLASLLSAGFSANPLALGICHPGGFLLPVTLRAAAQAAGCASAYFFGHDRPIS